MKEFTFPSRSSNAIYTVKMQDDGQTSCDCRGWIYSGSDRHCRHTDEVQGVTRVKKAKGSKKAAATKVKKTVQRTKKAAVDALKGMDIVDLPVPYYSPMLAQEGKPELVEERFTSDDWVAEEKYDGCFTYSSKVTLADGSQKDIGKIVHSKETFYVLSYNLTTNKVEPKKVTKKFINGQTRRWFKITLGKATGRGKGRTGGIIRGTSNHRIMTPSGWVKLSSLKVGDRVMARREKLHYFQKEVIKGSLLGDSSIRYAHNTNTNQGIAFGHCSKQLEYLTLKHNLLRQFATPIKKFTGGYGKDHYRFRLRALPCFNEFKKIPDNLSPLAIATWFMDDGSVLTLNKKTNQRQRATFHTQGFVAKDVNHLIKLLSSYRIFGKKANYGKGWQVSLDVESTERLFLLIAPYIPECLHYKVPDVTLGRSFLEEIEIPVEEELYAVPITHVKVEKPQSVHLAKKYDLEVEDNHNYFVDDVLVHNSRYLMYITKEGLPELVHQKKFNRFFSRRISVKDGLPVEKGANIPHLSDYDLSEWAGTVLDGEIIPASGVFTDTTKIMGSLPEVAILKQKQLGKVIYRVFDILYYKGSSLLDEPLNARLIYLNNIPMNKYMHQVKQTHGENNKRKLYDDIIARGGEGIILKHQQSKYQPGIRDKNVWMKVKKKQTHSVVVCGYEDPKQYSANVDGDTVENKHWLKKQIATIKFGVYKNNKLVEIGKCGGINDETREDISRNKKKYLGAVMEVEGQEVFKTGGIRFPHFIGFRHDLNPKDCTWKRIFSDS